MKSAKTSNCFRSFKRLVVAGVCLLPSLASAHPGHYHPDETDEFDFLRATIFHTHGALEWLLAGFVITGVVVVCLNQKPPVRIAALALAMASLSVFSAL